jgi:hypothetical protein
MRRIDNAALDELIKHQVHGPILDALLDLREERAGFMVIMHELRRTLGILRNIKEQLQLDQRRMDS